MTNPDDLERAVERLSEMLPRLDACSGYAAHSGTPAARQTGKPRDLYWNDHLASDLRLILSANREMRESKFKVGDLLTYDVAGTAVRCTYRGDCEGWPLVTFDADGPEAVAIHVRPSRVKARSALTTQRSASPAEAGLDGQAAKVLGSTGRPS